MLPMVAVRLRLGTLLSTDTVTLNQATNANHIVLVKAPFTPSENMVPTDITLADFTGSGVINVPLGAALVGVDPVTGDQVITIPTPAGGWRWITGDLVNLPQTIYGFAMLDKTGANLWGVQLLPVPLSLQTAGEVVDLGTVTITLLPQPMF